MALMHYMSLNYSQGNSAQGWSYMTNFTRVMHAV